MSNDSARPEAKPAQFKFPFHSCRNISGPDDENAGRKVLAGHAPANAFLDLDDNENVREYLVDAEGKRKASPTLVHQAIRKTLKEYPDRFSVLNGGICVVARGAEISDKEKVLWLERPSIINGSQTQGELKRFLQLPPEARLSIPSVTFEVIVTDDDDLIAEISIARNFQNDVRAISIAGRRGQLDELEAALQRNYPTAKLRKSETHISDDYLDTEKLVQVLFAVSPDMVWDKIDPTQSFKNKAYTYSQKTRCLKLFQRTVENKGEPGYSDLYKFFLDIAGEAWKLYSYWKSNQKFYGTRIKKIERTGSGEIIEVPDGLIFPIIAAYSAFAQKVRGTWNLKPPAAFDERELIEAAVSAYQDIADHNPQTMGKSKACYSTLLRVTSIYAKFSAKD